MIGLALLLAALVVVISIQTIEVQDMNFYRLHTHAAPGPDRRETSAYLGNLETVLHVSLSPEDGEGKRFAYPSASGPAMAKRSRCRHGATTFLQRARRALDHRGA